MSIKRIFLTEPGYPVGDLFLETTHIWAVSGECAGVPVAVTFETAHMFTAVIDGEEVKQWGDAFLHTHYGTSEKPPSRDVPGGRVHQCPALELPCCWRGNLTTSAVMLKYEWQAGGFDDEIIYTKLEYLYQQYTS